MVRFTCPTERPKSLPVATIEAVEVLSQTWPLTQQGRGVCVGRRFRGIDWRVIRIVRRSDFQHRRRR